MVLMACDDEHQSGVCRPAAWCVWLLAKPEAYAHLITGAAGADGLTADAGRPRAKDCEGGQASADGKSW